MNINEFLTKLPNDFPEPEIEDNDEGNINLDWIIDRFHVVTAEVDTKNNKVWIAAINDLDSFSDTFVYDGVIPENIINIMKSTLTPQLIENIE